jgi:hypothetical protein
MDPLLQRFIQETDRRFEQVSEQIKDVHEAVKDLTKFKVEMVVSARWTSMLVSAALGLVTLAASTAISVYITSKVQAAIPTKVSEK